MSDFDAKRLRFVAQMLDEHDKNGTNAPAELEMEFAKLSQKAQQIPRHERKMRQREKEQEATKFLYRARYA